MKLCENVRVSVHTKIIFCVYQDEEVAMLSELSHLQEVVDQLEKHTADPYSLPPASEQVIADANVNLFFE